MKKTLLIPLAIVGGITLSAIIFVIGMIAGRKKWDGTNADLVGALFPRSHSVNVDSGPGFPDWTNIMVDSDHGKTGGSYR